MKKALAGVVVVIVAALSAGSINTYSSAQNSGPGLRVSPTLIEHTAEPGETLVSSIEISNITDQALEVGISIADFDAGSDGQPIILAGETSENGMSNWSYSPTSISLLAGENSTVNVTYTVPNNAEKKTYWSSVLFRATNEGELAASVGTLQFVDVGSVQYDGSVDTVRLTEEGTSLQAIVAVTNTGQYRFTPDIKLVLEDAILGAPLEELIPQDIGSILPGQTREYTYDFNTRSGDTETYQISAEVSVDGAKLSGADVSAQLDSAVYAARLAQIEPVSGVIDEPAEQQSDEPESSNTLAYALIGLAVIGIIPVILAVVLHKKRKSSLPTHQPATESFTAEQTMQSQQTPQTPTVTDGMSSDESNKQL